MIIRAKCKVHLDADVLLLEATTRFETNRGEALPEESERASNAILDEANLYCTDQSNEEHDLYFDVIVSEGL